MRGNAFRALIAAVCVLTGAHASPGNAAADERKAPDTSNSDQKLLRLMEKARPPQGAVQGAPPSGSTSPAVSAGRLQERTRLLASGESALARLDTAAAIGAFDQAALILHAADTEIALVRGYMQNGEYRRALAFGAHTAGAHPDVVGCAALYAWLLHLGGQPAIAQRLLAQTRARMPGDALLEKVSRQLERGEPHADGPLLTLPARLAPYGSTQGMPPASRVTGSGLLLPGGGHALVPLASLPRSKAIWVRNATGLLSRGEVQKRFAEAGIALLTLDRPFGSQAGLAVPLRDAFPGSAAFAVEHVAASDTHPAWPVLRSGFLGGVLADDRRRLGIDMPRGPRGGPVFDSAGKLVGLALAGDGKSGDTLLPISALQRLMPELFQAGGAQPTSLQDNPPANQALRVSVDQIYESSLKICLQVITAP